MASVGLASSASRGALVQLIGSSVAVVVVVAIAAATAATLLVRIRKVKQEGPSASNKERASPKLRHKVVNALFSKAEMDQVCFYNFTSI